MTGPYQLWVLSAQTGAWMVGADGHNPQAVKARANTITGINWSRIELRDHHGREVLETIWDTSWGRFPGC